MPVYVLLQEMPYDEFISWMAYLEKRPIGWRDDDRAFKFLQTQGVKQKPWEVFGSLQPIYRPSAKVEGGKISAKSLMGSSLFNYIAGAQKGDKLDIWSES